MSAHASLRDSLIATFSGALMALYNYHPSLFDMLTHTDSFFNLVTAKHPKITLRCGDRKQI